jgi:hypothetical protein
MTPMTCGTHRRSSALHIYLVRYGIQMVRIHAGAIPTQVIDLKTIRNLGDHRLVCKTMSWDISPLQLEEAVAALVALALPLPAVP